MTKNFTLFKLFWYEHFGISNYKRFINKKPERLHAQAFTFDFVAVMSQVLAHPFHK